MDLFEGWLPVTIHHIHHCLCAEALIQIMADAAVDASVRKFPI
jgi:hypothetical protein